MINKFKDPENRVYAVVKSSSPVVAAESDDDDDDDDECKNGGNVPSNDRGRRHRSSSNGMSRPVVDGCANADAWNSAILVSASMAGTICRGGNEGRIYTGAGSDIHRKRKATDTKRNETNRISDPHKLARSPNHPQAEPRTPPTASEKNGGKQKKTHLNDPPDQLDTNLPPLGTGQPPILLPRRHDLRNSTNRLHSDLGDRIIQPSIQDLDDRRYPRRAPVNKRWWGR